MRRARVRTCHAAYLIPAYLVLLALPGCFLFSGNPDDDPVDTSSPPPSGAGFVPFDPADFPEPPAINQDPVVDTIDCLPPSRYDPDSASIVPREDNPNPCPIDQLLCNQQDGCDAFENTICPSVRLDGRPAPRNADDARGGCDDLEARPPGTCTQMDLCPDPGDAPANDAEAADPVPKLDREPLPPPVRQSGPGVANLLEETTRFVPPCLWDDAQDFADTSTQVPVIVPTWGDRATAPTEVYTTVDEARPGFGTPDAGTGDSRST